MSETQTIQSKRSDKTLAVATGTLVLRCGADQPWTTDTFEDAITATGVLRRTETATEHRVNDAILEFRCSVEYGPVFGAYESDLRRQAKAIARDAEVEVFHFQRRELTTSDIEKLIPQVDDTELSLADRKKLEKVITRVHRQASSNPDERES